MRLSRVWKLYLVFTVILIAGMTLTGFILQGQLKSRLNELLEENVLNLARVIAKVMPDTEETSILDPFAREYQKTARVRITIIKTDGRVIGESERQSLLVSDHLTRPEVRQAVTAGTGTAIRYSQSLGQDMFYVAYLIKGKNIILRLALPMDRVKGIENKVMTLLAIAVYLTPVLAIFIAFLFAKVVVREGGDYQ